jgi:hypothetical protein
MEAFFQAHSAEIGVFLPLPTRLTLRGALQLPTQDKRFRRFVARRLRLAWRDDFELVLEFLDDLAVTAAMKALDQQSAFRFQVILREFQREIAQMLHSRGIRARHP